MTDALNAREPADDHLKQCLEDERRKSAVNNEAILQRMGSDLHDGPAQLLTLGLMRLDTLLVDVEQLATNGQGAHGGDATVIRDGLSSVRSVLADCLGDIRAICGGLLLPELAGASVAEAITIAVSNHEAITGTKVTLAVDERLQCLMDLPLAVCAYRLVQEGLSNAFRHAGGVGQAVTAAWHDDRLTIEVTDGGPGLASHRLTPKPEPEAARLPRQSVGGGLGLSGLRERVRLLDGELTIESMPDKGVRLQSAFSRKR